MTQAHFMVDTETLGLAPDAVILSIGACRFFWDPAISLHPAKFYMELNPDLQTTRSIDSETLAWWDTQPNRPVGVHTMRYAVEAFVRYLYEVSDGNEIVIWCRGTDFDVPKLQSMFVESDIAAPWKYNNVRDLRTLDKLWPKLAPTRVSQKHNALADAEYQAHHAATILQYLNLSMT